MLICYLVNTVGKLALLGYNKFSIFRKILIIMTCIECETENPKYKCPVCRQPYCSVNCYKKHKLTPCETPPIPIPKDVCEDNKRPSQLQYDFCTEDTVAPEKLKLLEHSSELKKCVENPHVREILKTLDKSPHPDQLMQDYMLEPIFIEFVDACLKVVQPQED